MMRLLSIVIFILVLIAGITFALQNAQAVTVNYYVASSKLPLSLLLVIVLGMGAVIGWLTGIIVWVKLKAENIKLGHRLKLAEKELHQLRTQPVREN